MFLASVFFTHLSHYWALSLSLVLQEEERGGRVPAEQQRGEHDARHPSKSRRRDGKVLLVY